MPNACCVYLVVYCSLPLYVYTDAWIISISALGSLSLAAVSLSLPAAPSTAEGGRDEGVQCWCTGEAHALAGTGAVPEGVEQTCTWWQDRYLCRDSKCRVLYTLSFGRSDSGSFPTSVSMTSIYSSISTAV